MVVDYKGNLLLYLIEVRSQCTHHGLPFLRLLPLLLDDELQRVVQIVCLIFLFKHGAPFERGSVSVVTR